MDDFNFILNEDEALRGKKGSLSDSDYLNELMFELEAIDLGYTGSKYTWEKANGVVPQSREVQFCSSPEVTWLKDDRCSSVIEATWNENIIGSEFIKLYKKQASTKDALRKWNKEVFGNYQDKINSLLQNIKAIQAEPPLKKTGPLEEALQSKLSEWLLRSESLWH
ncbi:uncharacterized protein LOC142609043 [Castanea sativa]|uniref:uncharacterized protein LOC142609043 n=1 Tax=Castanea sativa TaxID=21020 RepID=UPI003F64B818